MKRIVHATAAALTALAQPLLKSGYGRYLLAAADEVRPN